MFIKKIMLMLAVVSLGACSSPVEPPTARATEAVADAQEPVQEQAATIVSEDDMAAEFWKATKAVTLPEGARWPEKAPLLPPAPDPKTGKELGNNYEQGYGTSVAENLWYCAWSREWLATPGSGPRADAALAKLETFKSMFSYKVGLAPSAQQSVDDMLEKASLGDPTAIAQHVKLNCQ